VRLLPSAPSRTTAPAVPATPLPSPALPVPEPALELASASPSTEVPTSELRVPEQAAPYPARGLGRELSTTFLDAERARISVTVPRRVLEKLEAARDALAHVIPDGNLAGVLEHALDLALAESRRKRALVETPRKASKPPRDGSRGIGLGHRSRSVALPARCRLSRSTGA